jgi:FKBP-type peptidyl-prolyl cis-trans isomerase
VWGQEEGGAYTYSRVDPATELDITRSDDGLVVIEYRDGVGREVQDGDTFSVHYHGWFARNATTFDTSRTRMAPYAYQYPGTMVEGWHRGVEGMKPGTLRRFYIPYMLGYKEQGQPPRMPGRSNLIFEVECVSVTAQAAPPAPAGARPPQQPAQDTPSGQ